MQPDDETVRRSRWSLTSFAVGALTGAVGALAALWRTAPSLTMLEAESPYDFETTTDRFEAAVAETEGWKILGDYDLQAKMDKHGYRVDQAAVYEICAPEYASNILSRDDERIVTPMMPCRVSVYEKSDGRTYVGRMNADLLSRLFGGVIQRTMSKAYRDSEAIVEATLDPSHDLGVADGSDPDTTPESSADSEAKRGSSGSAND